MEVNLIAVTRVDTIDQTSLDGVSVPQISSRLDGEPENEPSALGENEARCFIGFLVRGIGFVLDPPEAERLISADPRNNDCIKPYLTGEDINGGLGQNPSRFVIYFRDWTQERANEYPALLRICEDRVKPERLKLPPNSSDYRKLRTKWWLFARVAIDMQGAVGKLSQMLVRSRVSEFHMIVFVPTNLIANEQVTVFAYDDYFHFALLQSNIHESWVRRNASTMRTDIRYTPTDCFRTFAFPQTPAEAARTKAERLGAAYHEHRQQTMIAHQLGLTKTYNLFHKAQCDDADIARLRELHVTMDWAILACYGWTDVDPGHGFHQNERGQTRYTISPVARREILRRLLNLDLEIAARETAGETPRRRRG